MQSTQHQISNQNTLLTFGLAVRAQKAVFGEEACLEAIRKHQAMLLFLDMDASDNTKKRFENACQHHETPLWFFDRAKADLPCAAGKPQGKVFALTDAGFARKLCQWEHREADAPPQSAARAPNRKPERGKNSRKHRKEPDDESLKKRSVTAIEKMEVER